ncbi:hypothetical protein VSR01_21640 [Actinacidiphila sp. DG2A-62]|jgi:hypothetical protein|uniref:hypothetical protein n=1 Tax=Actinacidiphila sp. DG2A-62 TaxID=3108821 RepID=UPI002DBD16AB|nr:hypothetical protein [Actinacidiphila sp. DG2A-62]MEC3995981.1 hypothetical protein [Actinacidiphila sp. DG2A-62]
MRSVMRRRAPFAALLAGVLLGVLAGPAWADRGSAPTQPPTRTPEIHNGELSSRVSVTGTGTQSDDSTQPITSVNASFTPPDCWYEALTPAEFEAYLNQRYDDAGNAMEDTVYDYLYQIRSDMNAIHYHQDDKGAWWVLAYNPDLPEYSAGTCTLSNPWEWVKAGDPPPPASVTPEMLSKVAYGATHLRKGKVELSPAAGNQKVNLATYLKFEAALPEVYVTAQVPNPPVAATVVADPYSLHVEAGTKWADPSSCDYKFVKNGDTYNIDTSGAGCNITYRKSSNGGTYQLTAQITWHVHWTATADPHGPAAGTMDDGYTTAVQNVTVREIQSVNR